MIDKEDTFVLKELGGVLKNGVSSGVRKVTSTLSKKKSVANEDIEYDVGEVNQEVFMVRDTFPMTKNITIVILIVKAVA